MTLPTPLRCLLLLACAGSGLFLFTGCDEVAYDERPAYYGGGSDVDFYYVGGRPYSHRYGELIVRDGGYYYNRGGSVVVYHRGPARHAYHEERGNYGGNYAYERDRNYRRAEYERNNRHTTVNNYYETNSSARTRNAPVHGPQYPQRGGYQQVRQPYVQNQIRGAQPLQGQPGQPAHKKHKDDDHH